MPLYDFRCRACDRVFEALVRGEGGPSCPNCGAADPERLLSTFAVTSREKRQAAATTKRRQEAAEGRRARAAEERAIDRHRREDH